MARKHNLIERVCEDCGDTYIGTKWSYKCPSCYAYLRVHPEGAYPQPDYGEVLYASNGDPVCHICCKAYRKLGNHIRFKHKITQEEYRETFGLHHNTRLSNQDYINQMRIYNIVNKETVIDRNLIKRGKKTRISKKHNLPGRKIGNNQITFIYSKKIKDTK